MTHSCCLRPPTDLLSTDMTRRCVTHNLLHLPRPPLPWFVAKQKELRAKFVEQHTSKLSANTDEQGLVIVNEKTAMVPPLAQPLTPMCRAV